MSAPEFLLVKRGLYYRPDNCGYTGVKALAGRYHADEADTRSEVEAIHESEAPMFSPACWQDVKVKFLLDELLERDKTIAGLCAALRQVIPSNVCLTNPNVRDGVIVPIDVTMGELRQVRAAIDKATRP